MGSRVGCEPRIEVIVKIVGGGSCPGGGGESRGGDGVVWGIVVGV